MYKQLLTIFAFSLLATTAHASIANDAVESDNHNYVSDEEGDCVRSKWMVPGDKCEDQVVTEEIEMEKVEERVVLFDFNKHNIKADYVKNLDRLIDILNYNKITHIKIVGYTDIVGSEEYNKKLSRKRAESVNKYLNKHMKLESSIIELRAMGKTNEFADCEGQKGAGLISCMKPNRRVEVEIDYNFHEQRTVVIPWKDRMNNSQNNSDTEE